MKVVEIRGHWPRNLRKNIIDLNSLKENNLKNKEVWKKSADLRKTPFEIEDIIVLITETLNLQSNINL